MLTFAIAFLQVGNILFDIEQLLLVIVAFGVLLLLLLN